MSAIDFNIDDFTKNDRYFLGHLSRHFKFANYGNCKCVISFNINYLFRFYYTIAQPPNIINSKHPTTFIIALRKCCDCHDILYFSYDCVCIHTGEDVTPSEKLINLLRLRKMPLEFYNIPGMNKHPELLANAWDEVYSGS